MLAYMTVKDAAEKWNISRRRVNTLCQENRIPNAAMLGNMWIIPKDSKKPLDKRKSKAIIKTERRFIVTIEEVVSEDFDVTTDCIENAIQLACKKYNSEEFVLSPGNLESKQLMVYDVNNNIYSYWVDLK